jgi:hypothetical protein
MESLDNRFTSQVDFNIKDFMKSYDDAGLQITGAELEFKGQKPQPV